MDSISEKTVSAIARELKKDIIQLREAEEIVPRRTDDYIVEDSVLKTIDLNQKFSEIGLTGLHVQMNRVDYWRKILIAKITMINLMGGYELAEKVCMQLDSYDEEITDYNKMISTQSTDPANTHLKKKAYHYKKAFSLLADGVIDHWTQLV